MILCHLGKKYIQTNDIVLTIISVGQRQDHSITNSSESISVESWREISIEESLVTSSDFDSAADS